MYNTENHQSIHDLAIDAAFDLASLAQLPQPQSFAEYAEAIESVRAAASGVGTPDRENLSDLADCMQLMLSRSISFHHSINRGKSA